MKVLVTGAGGTVGNAVCDFLVQYGYEVTGIYRNRKPVNSSIRQYRMDLSRDNIPDDQFEVIIHIAAGLTGSTDSLITNNLTATRNLISYMQKNAVKKFIYISSVSVFGKTQDVVTESSPIVDPEIYGMTKYLAENLVKEGIAEEKIIVRLPRMLSRYIDIDNEGNSGFLAMTKRLFYDQDVTCYIPNVKYNNYMHVKALSEFLNHIILQNSRGIQEVNLGVEGSMTMLQILELMKEEIKSKSVISSCDKGETPKCSLISIDHAKQMGFLPMTAEETIRLFARELREKRMTE